MCVYWVCMLGWISLMLIQMLICGIPSAALPPAWPRPTREGNWLPGFLLCLAPLQGSNQSVSIGCLHRCWYSDFYCFHLSLSKSYVDLFQYHGSQRGQTAFLRSFISLKKRLRKHLFLLYWPQEVCLWLNYGPFPGCFNPSCTVAIETPWILPLCSQSLWLNAPAWIPPVWCAACLYFGLHENGFLFIFLNVCHATILC